MSQSSNLTRRDAESLSPIVDRWRACAVEAFYDVEDWRHDPRGPHPAHWLTLDPEFGPDTYALARAMREQKLDPAPVEDLYATYTTWHERRAAQALPIQPVIEERMRLAMARLDAFQRLAIKRLAALSPTLRRVLELLRSRRGEVVSVHEFPCENPRDAVKKLRAAGYKVETAPRESLVNGYFMRVECRKQIATDPA